MSTTYSYSTTFTRTNARYLASKVAADLRQMRLFYGRPFDTEIDNYVEELTELLVGGYLESVDYGFHRNDGWAVAVGYIVVNGTLTTDDRAGRVTPGVNISGAAWYSFLRYSSKWHGLSQAERNRIATTIPVKRNNANEPTVGFANFWVEDKVYTSGGTSFTRRTIRSS